MPLLLFFAIWLVLELMVLSAVVDVFSVLGTLALVITSVLAGIAILRGEQIRFLLKMQQMQPLHQGDGGGIYRVLAGVLLIFPGFISDILALCLFFAPLRRLLGLGLLRAFKPERVVRGFGFKVKPDVSYEYDGEVQAHRADGSVIEAEIIDSSTPRKRD